MSFWSITGQAQALAVFIKKPISFKLTKIRFFNHTCNLQDYEGEDKGLNLVSTNKHLVEKSKNKTSNNKCKFILGRSGPNEQSYKLALEILKQGKPVNYNNINDIFSYCNIKITEDNLKNLTSRPSFILTDLDKEETINILKEKLGSPFSKIKISGVYIFKHKVTGDKYVGSSSQLAFRLNTYLRKSLKFNSEHSLDDLLKKEKSQGKLIPLLKKDKLTKFTLEVIPLYDKYDFKPEIVLEQYFLLDPSFNLNTIKVANNPSGSNAKSLYMYNRDKTILYYSSFKQIDFINKLNISHFTFTKHLNKGSYYLGKYFFTRKLELSCKVKNISLLELQIQLEKDRIKFNKNKPLSSLSKSLYLIDENNNTKLFFSIGKCIIYLRKKGLSATQTTLVKYIDTGITYHGYTFRSALDHRYTLDVSNKVA
jgi:GIY-YIG catalytic domain